MNLPLGAARLKRRRFIATLFAGLAAPGAWSNAAPIVEVWRSPSCGCCGAWVRHLQDAGFATRVHSVEDLAPVRRRLGIPVALASCHSATVGGYVIEGHVPADSIRRLLEKKPQARGLAVPGMPPGSPGMDVPGSPPYDVLLVDRGGGTSVVSRHAAR